MTTTTGDALRRVKQFLDEEGLTIVNTREVDESAIFPPEVLGMVICDLLAAAAERPDE